MPKRKQRKRSRCPFWHHKALFSALWRNWLTEGSAARLLLRFLLPVWCSWNTNAAARKSCTVRCTKLSILLWDTESSSLKICVNIWVPWSSPDFNVILFQVFLIKYQMLPLQRLKCQVTDHQNYFFWSNSESSCGFSSLDPLILWFFFDKLNE